MLNKKIIRIEFFRKRSTWVYFIFLLLFSSMFFGYGVLVGGYRIFPYIHLREMANSLPISMLPKTQNSSRVELFNYFSPNFDVVMIGDSITRSAEWNEIFPSVKIANRGINGDTISDILARLDSVLSVQPQRALLMVGINDIYRGIPVNDIVRDYKIVVSILVQNDIEVIVQSTLECTIGSGGCGSKQITAVRNLNDRLQKYTNEIDLRYIDINKGLSSKETGLLPKYSYDGVHLSAEGYFVWAKQIEEVIVVT